METSKKSLELEVFFFQITENLTIAMNAIKTNKELMSMANVSFSKCKESLLSRYSFCYTVLETVVNHNSKFIKQCDLSACVLALESHIMANAQDQEASLDFERIIDWTSIEYKNGGYAMSSKLYLTKVSLIYLLLCEVSKKKNGKKTTI